MYGRFIIEGVRKNLQELQEEWKCNENTKRYFDDLVTLSKRLLEKAQEDEVIEHCVLYAPGDCDCEVALEIFAKALGAKCVPEYYEKDERVLARLKAYGWYMFRSL